MSISIFTSVVTPAASYDLIDLATAKDELGISSTSVGQDEWTKRAITQVSASIASYCGQRVFAVETVMDTFRIVADGRRHVFRSLKLSRHPIKDIVSCAADGDTLVEDADFVVDYGAGSISALCGDTEVAWTTFPVSVQYSAGYSTLPNDLVQAALRLIAMRYKQKDRDPMLVENSDQASGQQRYWVGGLPNQKGPFPPDVCALIDPYVDVRVG